MKKSRYEVKDIRGRQVGPVNLSEEPASGMVITVAGEEYLVLRVNGRIITAQPNTADDVLRLSHTGLQPHERHKFGR